jgi:ankyrin repeat protein
MLTVLADGSTALHCAAWKGHVEAVTYLLAAVSDVHVHNTNEHKQKVANAGYKGVYSYQV